MSSTTAESTSQHERSPASGAGIYLAFAPWIVFTLLTAHSTLKLATAGALVAAVAIAGRSILRGSPKTLELGAAATFAGLAVVAFTSDAATGAFLARYARAIAAGALSLIAFASLLAMPFTEQYARETVPRVLWSSPRFRQLNRQLTAMWGLVFAAMVPAHVIAGARWTPTVPT